MNVRGERNLVDSPCIGICSATALGDAVCLGCGRTFQEVVEWNTYSVEKRMVINKRLLDYSR